MNNAKTKCKMKFRQDQDDVHESCGSKT